MQDARVLVLFGVLIGVACYLFQWYLGHEDKTLTLRGRVLSRYYQSAFNGFVVPYAARTPNQTWNSMFADIEVEDGSSVRLRVPATLLNRLEEGLFFEFTVRGAKVTNAVQLPEPGVELETSTEGHPIPP